MATRDSGVAYRITSPIVAIVKEGGKEVARMLQEGSIIRVADPSALDENNLITAKWEDTTVTMFVQDLRERAERIMVREA
jgi:hypothetical protein